MRLIDLRTMLRNRKLRKWPMFAFVAAVSLAGVLLIMSIDAKVLTSSYEAEDAALSGNAESVDDTSASGGQAISYRAPEASTSCSNNPGAGSGASNRGPTTYNSSGTTTVSNVVFDGSHSDDLVRVYNGKVIFENVTFRGNGTGSTGHTLEIKQGGSAEVRNSVFEGSPAEDSIQTEGNGTTLIECNTIAGSPGEDHLDTKPGGEVTVRKNDFSTSASGMTVQNHNSSNPVHLIENTGIERVFYESGQSDGTIVGNDISEYIWLYDVNRILLKDNTVDLIKHGAGSSDRDPNSTYLLNNSINSFSFNGGSCYKNSNTGASLGQCSNGAPSWYQP